MSEKNEKNNIEKIYHRAYQLYAGYIALMMELSDNQLTLIQKYRDNNKYKLAYYQFRLSADIRHCEVQAHFYKKLSSDLAEVINNRSCVW